MIENVVRFQNYFQQRASEFVAYDFNTRKQDGQTDRRTDKL